jgi:hypothetical protein
VSVPAASAASAGSSHRGIARYAAVLCLFAVAAAVVSFVKGGGFGWLGIVWVLLAGLSSNMAWYYGRRARRSRTAAATDTGADSSTADTSPDAGSVETGVTSTTAAE